VVVSHLASPFTESLDPIKAREIFAVGSPTNSARIVGFRDLGPSIRVVGPDQSLDTSCRLSRILVGVELGASP
jgi:hypothetical protein